MSNIKRTAERENLSAVLFCDFLLELKEYFYESIFSERIYSLGLTPVIFLKTFEK